MTMSGRVGRWLSVVCATALLGAACSSEGSTSSESPTASETGSEPTASVDVTPSGTLRLFSYSDGFDPDYMETFFQQYPDIDLETAAFGSNDEAVAKLLAGFEADVVNSCVDEATLEMVQRGLYQPLDVSRLEHWDDLFPSMKELPGVQVDGQVYIVPVDAGTAGIMYDADVVTDVPDSWTDLFDPQYAGRASLEDLSVTAIDVGALANGITDPLSMDASQLEMVKQFLIDHRDQFRTFWKGEADIKSQFKNGEVVISSGYPGVAKALRDDGVNVQFAAAEEGQMLWTCGYGISPEAENLDAAYALLNWYTSLPPQIYAAENFSYVTSNSNIVDEVSEEVLNATGIKGFVTGEAGAPTTVNLIPASPPEDAAAWRAAWTEVKAG
jgi:spermidine/putrescine transport system substrate-binding protein